MNSDTGDLGRPESESLTSTPSMTRMPSSTSTFTEDLYSIGDITGIDGRFSMGDRGDDDKRELKGERRWSFRAVEWGGSGELEAEEEEAERGRRQWVQRRREGSTSGEPADVGLEGQALKGGLRKALAVGEEKRAPRRRTNLATIRTIHLCWKKERAAEMNGIGS